MLATPRGRTPYDEVLCRRGAPPIPPPPPPRKYVEGRAPGRAAIDADPKWLEEAVLRIIQKHGLRLAAAEEIEVELDPEDLHLLPAPSRFWRIARTALIVVVLAGSAAAFARWRYPAQTATVLMTTKAVAVRIGPPSSWGTALRARARSLHMPRFPERTESAPVVEPAASPSFLPMAPAPQVAPTPAAPALAPKAVSTSSPPTATAEVPTAHSIQAARVEAKRAEHITHVAPAVPPPVETAAEPAPGSLAEAIKRAGAGPKPTPAPERAAISDPKPATDPSLPERPSASMVTSALLAVLPDARACLEDGDEAKPAVVVFESSGAVRSVQVSGGSAPCIQKALARARVAPFAQPSYRATVPVRPN